MTATQKDTKGACLSLLLMSGAYGALFTGIIAVGGGRLALAATCGVGVALVTFCALALVVGGAWRDTPSPKDGEK